ncbi:chemotaxis protein CheB [Gemmata sp.]|uniref:chemotaxis protein CheB n=1 Tax=Gemmata sp. TaxID=1914242 RepID=UPI003F706376
MAADPTETASGSVPAAPHGPPPQFFVGVGASAGGLEALERLFEHMPPDTGMAFIVVQHLSPDFKSLTNDILARRTRLPIRVVEDGMHIRPDSIYLIPPRKDMIVRGGRLLLTDKDLDQLVALPIDHFFRSLAQEAGDQAVAVVLSGTGSDGSRGVRDVHAAGGLVVVQAPDTAKFDGMPKSAIDTGTTDLVLAPEEIPAALVRHALAPHSDPAPAALLVGVDAVFRLLRDAYGIDFSSYKPDTVTRRLERRIGLGDIPGLDEYARRLAGDPAELNLLYKDLMIGVTRFFRDEEGFARLGRDVLPALIGRLAPGDEFRAWVAGCATGEEAYSLAMLVREALDTVPRAVPVKIFATDAHRASIEAAGLGLYTEAAMAGVAPDRATRFFTRAAGGFQVSAELRKMVVFAQHNLLKDAPFTRLDLASCRNVLIYFQPPAQKRVLSLFHFALKTGGTLFLGPSETTGEIGDEFEAVDSHWRLYRKRRDVRLVPDLRLPAVAPVRPAPGLPAAGPDPNLASAYDALLDQFMPPALLVTERGALVQTFGGASKYLRFRDGRVTSDLLELVAPELRTALTGALPRAFKELADVTYKGLRVAAPDGERLVNVTVRPVRNRRAVVTHALVQIEEVGAAPPPRDVPQEIDLGQASRDHLLELEGELRHTKENLQALIEEMETSNEELQATNQELTAANEELQSTNEELHSVNEELYTVNAEFQKKIAELTQLSADVDNLLMSTGVHTMFLDRALCLRKFTPKIAESFNLLPQDIGRRIDHFTYTIDHPGMLADLRAVLDHPTPIERQVRDRRGHWFLLRILPYRAGLAIDGVVLTLIDLSEVKRAEAEARRKDEQLAGILRHSPNWVFIKDLAGRYSVADDSFRRAVGQDPVGKTAGDLFSPDVARLVTAGDDRVIDQGVDDQAEIVIPLADGPHTFLATKFPVRDEAGRVVGVGGIKTDVTAIRQAEQTAREAVDQRDRFLAILSHELRNPLAAVLSAADLAARAAPAGSEAARWLGVIGRRARHTARLVDDLLDVARFSQDKVEVRRVPTDLGATVPGVLEEVRPWFDEARVALTQEGPDGPVLVDGDPDRLQQVQVNLLRNAAKYTPAGGRVWYTLGREDGHAVIRVRDTGVGLSAEMLGRVFEPFVQADETLDRSGGGIGVGLTLVRSIVELHGGTVEGRSGGAGTGCEFVIRLALAAAGPPAAAPALGAAAPAAADALRILVIEDDADIRTSLVALLELDGHAVRAAANGPAGLAALDLGGGFDAVLLDIGLPGMNGFEVARRVRGRPGPPPHLVALTGYGRTEDRAATAAAGFDAHVTKPFDPAELSRVLAAFRTTGPPRLPPHDGPPGRG